LPDALREMTGKSPGSRPIRCPPFRGDRAAGVRDAARLPMTEVYLLGFFGLAGERES